MAGGKRRKYDDIHMTPDVSYITNPDVSHEESDVAVGPIAKFVVGLFVFGVVICVLMWLLFNFLERRAVQSERRPSPLARRGEDSLPPEPRLQLAPGFGVTLPDGRRADLSNDGQSRTGQQPQPQSEYWVVREEWDKQLKNYGWADESAGTVRLPIEEAMRLYVEEQKQQQQQGAQPATPQTNAPRPSAQGEQVPASSSSGRTGERRNQ